jgi:superfamily II DNA/RNA helicase
MTNENLEKTSCDALLKQLGFATPTEIQRQAMPLLANGESVLALSPTGSGKTLAFLIPLMERLDPNLSETQLLVLAPTRELGAQIAHVASQVAAHLAEHESRHLQVRAVFGGHKSDTQKKEILKNPQIVVATPGRALDLITQNVLKLSNLRALVLDEADIMVGMGFEAQIKSICDELPNRIQAALFSATESEGQSRLQNRLVHRGKRVDVRHEVQSESDTEATTKSVFTHQTVLVPQGMERLAVLTQLLQQISPSTESGIVFCQTRDAVQKVVETLKAAGVSVAGLSGELGQIERDTMMRLFRAGGVKYLVATNLAARGIDVSDVSVVVHYELPSTQQEYLHRSGRTGRAGKSGRTISLCNPNAKKFLQELLKDTEIELADLALENAEPVSTPVAKDYVKIHINRGKSSKLRPGDFLGALTQDLGLTRHDVGAIYIFDHFTHVEITQPQAGSVLKRLTGRKIKNLVVKATPASALTAPRARTH